tara:strand:+ start:344 stop:1225 length:882 start_codon:yes stop_codon:yes gene_type:complete
MGTKVAAPPPRDYGKEMASGLKAQAELMTGTGQFKEFGPLVEMEAEQRPQWTDLELSTLSDTLRGTDSQEGLMSLYKNYITPTLSETEATADSFRRRSDLGDVQQYGKAATDAFLDSDPLKREASDLLLRGAIDEYKLGAKLDPSLAREVQQGYRQAAGARGMAHSPYSAAEEAYWQGLQAEQLKRQRQAALSGLLGQRQQLVGDPFMQVLGRQGQSFGVTPGYGTQGLAMGQALGPRIFQPESQMQQDISSQNMQTQLAVRQANAANRSAMIGGGLGATGSIFGGLGAGGYF